MIRAFARQTDQSGTVIGVNAVTPAEGARLMQMPDYHIWFDACAPSDDDYRWLDQTFHFHPLTIEDAKQHDPRAKVTEYEGYLFITLHTPRRQDEHEESDEIHVWLSGKYFVSVHDLDNPIINNLIELQRMNFSLSEWGASFLLYRLSDLVVDAYFPVLDNLGDRMDSLEDRIVSDISQNQLNEIFALKQDLVFLRKTIGPMREVFNSLLIRRYSLIDERALVYLRDVYEHIVRFYDIIDSYRDLASNALDAYLSTVSNNLNLVMKRLTIITTIFMPLTFVTGFFGMNFVHLPFENDLVFWTAMAVMLFGVVGMLLWFKHERWL